MCEQADRPWYYVGRDSWNRQSTLPTSSGQDSPDPVLRPHVPGLAHPSPLLQTCQEVLRGGLRRG